jgi:dTDP-4-dehydrorhamnose reductase
MTMNRTIFIIGTGSLTGFKLSLKAKNHFSIYGCHNLRNPSLDHVNSIKIDLTNLTKLREHLQKIKPDIVINCSALNNVDYCENHKLEAKNLNFHIVSEISKITHSLGSKLVHLSTDSVFDGNKNISYTENDSPNPMNVYGETKLEGEKVVLNNPNNLVVRASVLYGWLPQYLAKLETSSLKPQNFAQWLISTILSGQSVKIIKDEISSPIIADDFANSILYLINNDLEGLFHSSPNNNISRYEFSVQMIKHLNLDSSLIHPTTINELGRKVNTGNNKSLNSLKLQKKGFKFMSMKESFELLKNQINK